MVSVDIDELSRFLFMSLEFQIATLRSVCSIQRNAPLAQFLLVQIMTDKIRRRRLHHSHVNWRAIAEVTVATGMMRSKHQVRDARMS